MFNGSYFDRLKINTNKFRPGMIDSVLYDSSIFSENTFLIKYYTYLANSLALGYKIGISRKQDETSLRRVQQLSILVV